MFFYIYYQCIIFVKKLKAKNKWFIAKNAKDDNNDDERTKIIFAVPEYNDNDTDYDDDDDESSENENILFTQNNNNKMITILMATQCLKKCIKNLRIQKGENSNNNEMDLLILKSFNEQILKYATM